ncbi:uncharacterized protein V6R79_016038 [Siganus canaliculatus]
MKATRRRHQLGVLLRSLLSHSAACDKRRSRLARVRRGEVAMHDLDWTCCSGLMGLTSRSGEKTSTQYELKKDLCPLCSRCEDSDAAGIQNRLTILRLKLNIIQRTPAIN